MAEEGQELSTKEETALMSRFLSYSSDRSDARRGFCPMQTTVQIALTLMANQLGQRRLEWLTDLFQCMQAAVIAEDDQNQVEGFIAEKERNARWLRAQIATQTGTLERPPASRSRSTTIPHGDSL